MQNKTINNKIVDIIIPTFNRSTILLSLLKQFKKQLFLSNLYKYFNIIIIDNNSLPFHSNKIKAYVNKNIFINYYFCKKPGLSNAKNYAIKISNSKYIAFLDDDLRINNRYISNLFNLIKNKKFDIATGPIYSFYYNKKKPFFYLDNFDNRNISLHDGFHNSINIPGGNCVFRKSLFKVLGYYNVKLGMIGNKICFGEDREMINKYYKNFNPPLIFLSKGLSVHTIEIPHKISFSYMTSRSFQSGVYSYKKLYAEDRFNRILALYEIIFSAIYTLYYFLLLVFENIIYFIFSKKYKFKFYNHRTFLKHLYNISFITGRLYGSFIKK